MIEKPSWTLIWMLLVTGGVLLVGSILRILALRKADENLKKKRLGSLRSWWYITVITSASLLLGDIGVCFFMMVVSFFGFKEYLTMLDIHKRDATTVKACYVILIINYLLILFAVQQLYFIFVPVAGIFTISIFRITSGESDGYVEFTSKSFWGLMFVVYGISHAAMLMVTPQTSVGPVGPAGWFLYLLLLTEMNDIIQALVGRRLGGHLRHRIKPALSPNKTWEGFIGGVIGSALLGLFLAPRLTTLATQTGPLPSFIPIAGWFAPLISALLISIGGFFGDINISGLKRSSGAKDSGSFFPGMGGLLDRIDSLTMSAPLFFYFVIWWCS